MHRLTRAIRPRATGEPTSGMTTNGMRNVPLIAPRVLADRSRPELPPTWPFGSAMRAEVAGKVRPITNVAGRTTKATGSGEIGEQRPKVRGQAEDCVAEPRSMIVTIPMVTRTAITIWPMASRLIVLIRVRRRLKATAPRARPIRKIVRIVVKT